MAEIKTGVIINARTNQGRWPDKILANLGGKPVVEQIVIRAKQVTGADTIILATSDLVEDLQLEGLAMKYDIALWAGEPDDVIQRDFDACMYYKLDYYMAIPASWPMFSADGANEKIITAKQYPGFDEYCTIDFPVHAGLFVHLSSVKMLKRLIEKPDRPKRFEWIPDFPHSHYFTKTRDEIKNYQLIDLNIAYPMHLAILNKIIDHLGHYPGNYDEIKKAYWEIKKL